MPGPEDHLRRLVDELLATDDPIRALEALVELGTLVDDLTRERASQGLGAGYSFGDIARALGMSRQAAHRRFRDVGPTARRIEPPHILKPRQLGATEPAKQVLRLARDEAVRRDAVAVGSEHVLIAVLRYGGPVARMLHRHGVRLETAVEASRSMAADVSRPPDRGGPAEGVRRLLADAARVALVRGDREVDVHAVLLAALADSDGRACWVLTELGARVTSIRLELERVRPPECRQDDDRPRLRAS